MPLNPMQRTPHNPYAWNPANAQPANMIDPNGYLRVVPQDKTTPPIILPMVQQLGVTTLTGDTVVDAYTINVTSSTGMVIGQHLRIINSLADRFYNGTVLGIAANVITVDSPLDFIYIAGSEVTYNNKNMNVDGSVTPVTFRIRTGAPSIPSYGDVTRIIFTCITDSAVDLSKFGNLAALTRGLVFRLVNDVQVNIFNVKSNEEIASIAGEWTPYQSINPQQGVDGFVSTIHFAGEDKIGTALRTGPDDNLEMIVQDDLTGLTNMFVVFEGHLIST